MIEVHILRSSFTSDEMAVDDFAAVYSRNRRGYGNRGCRPFHTSMGKKIISPSRSNLAKKKSKS
jgi:hypothetical protein